MSGENAGRRATDGIGAQSDLIVRMIESLSDKTDAVHDKITELQISGEQRTAQVTALSLKIDQHAKDEAENHEDHEKRIQLMEQHMTFFRATSRVVSLVSYGIGLAIISSVVYSIVWTVKKVFGIDLSHFISVSGTPV